LIVFYGDDGRLSSIDVSHCENEADYGDLFDQLKDRGLSGVQLVISDDHEGTKKAVHRHSCTVIHVKKLDAESRGFAFAFASYLPLTCKGD